MYSSAYVSKRFVLVPILVVVATQLLFARIVSSLNLTNAYLHHKCLVSQGKYKPGSKYEKSLIEITQSLSKSHILHAGFGMIGYGKEPDMVAVTFQCRIDSRGPKCGSCIATAQSELRKRCRGNKGAIIWYDQCLVEFSTFDTTAQINYDDNFCMPSTKNLRSIDSIPFGERVALLNNLTELAITKSDKNIKDVKAPVLYAAGERKLGKINLYGMVQCTAYLSAEGCIECIRHYIIHFQDCWKLKQGVRVLSSSCNYRYEIYPFISPKSPYYTKF